MLTLPKRLLLPQARQWVSALTMLMMTCVGWSNGCSWANPEYDKANSVRYVQLDETTPQMREMLSRLTPEDPSRTQVERCERFIVRTRGAAYPSSLLARQLHDCETQLARNQGQSAPVVFLANAAAPAVADTLAATRLESALIIESTWYVRIGDAFKANQLMADSFELRQRLDPQNLGVRRTLKSLRDFTKAHLTRIEQIEVLQQHCYQHVRPGAAEGADIMLRDASLAILWPEGAREDVDLNTVTPNTLELPDTAHPISVTGQATLLSIGYTDRGGHSRHVVYDFHSEGFVFAHRH